MGYNGRVLCMHMNMFNGNVYDHIYICSMQSVHIRTAKEQWYVCGAHIIV